MGELTHGSEKKACAVFEKYVIYTTRLVEKVHIPKHIVYFLMELAAGLQIWRCKWCNSKRKIGQQVICSSHGKLRDKESCNDELKQDKRCQDDFATGQEFLMVFLVFSDTKSVL